jgi:hypothetical protein
MLQSKVRQIKVLQGKSRWNSPLLKAVFLMLPFLLSATALMGLGKQDSSEKLKGEKPKTVQVTGRVRLIGSGPGIELVITGTNREWHIDKKDQDILWNLQQQNVTVEGRETSKEMTFANGTSAGTWYYLSDIKIIGPIPGK